MIRHPIRALALAAVIAGCSSTATTSPAPATVPATVPTTAEPTVTAPHTFFGLLPTTHAPPAMPNRKLTPGAVQTTDVHQVCPHTNPAFEKARPGTSVKNKVYAEYGIASHTTGQYEVDHLIPLELGGANTIANLWPELNDHPRSGVLNSKDLLENKLHSLVCSGKVSLTAAQKAIATNWYEAYQRYVADAGG
jgi:hypothetical protein